MIALLAIACITGCAQDSKPSQSRDRGLAAIVDSGSANANGFRILVQRSGKTQSVVIPKDPGPQPIELPVTTLGRIPAALARRLYSDLDAAWPISALPRQSCAKSPPIETVLIIEFDYQQTPDLNCGSPKDPKLRALVRDAQAIVAASRKQPAGGR